MVTATRERAVRRIALPIATGAFAALFGLGFFVSHVPPAIWDSNVQRSFAGSGTGLALLFTRSCHWYVLVALGAVLVAVAATSLTWRGRAVFSIVATIAGWQMSDALKAVFSRPRPPDWIAIRETSFGYPSGHAMFAVVVYGLWSFFIWNSDIPSNARRALSVFLAMWAIGILWSRLALGAHFPTDLLGGVLLGAGVVATGFAIAPVVWPRSGRQDAAN